MSEDRADRLTRLGGLGFTLVYAALIGWLFVRQPQTVAQITGGLASTIGVYSVANNPVDLVIMAAFGVFGIACLKLGMEPTPMALGVVLGPLMEENLRRAMLLARGDPTVFVTRPISAGLIFASVVVLVLLALPAFRKKREEVFREEEPAAA